MRTGWVLLLLLSVQFCSAAESQGMNDSTEVWAPEDHFQSGRFEAAVINGFYFSPFIATHNRPTIDYTYSGIQLGYMLGDVKGDGWRRGNFEVAGEAFGSAIVQGDGSFITGGTLWLRYNFVPQRTAKLIPFAEAGAGAVSTDISHDIVGQPFNFNLDMGLGARYFVSRNWALSLEYRFQHISNANTGNHNLGINSNGPFLGVSYFF